ncbi:MULTISPECIES: hypothetical protein [unclassified Leclercia]|uniref:Uncharacterized protein n=1 Tax=Leclercia barmai TaxID=2785629 RepID=A0ABS7RUK5_9ENTR|nr:MULTISPECIES: hypothetical protein [unclassified Leclercia]MBZ0057470.1 hypothetical protein [Leclercia sp. EMC7]MCM5695634.1 hypothetical protein [Leclercia sp. LTM01]MCM5700042.1 hypothetical protein [Leclercia sp. LTM14]
MSTDSYDEYAQMLAQDQERRAERFHAITIRENERLLGHGQFSSIAVEEDLNGDRFTRDYEQGGQIVYLDDNEWKGEYDMDD